VKTATPSDNSHLLDRTPSDDYLRECTRRIAEQKTEDKGDAVSVLIFRVGGEYLALPTIVLQEVADNHTLHSVPHRGGIVAGIATIRGEILLCASLPKLLGLEEVSSEKDSSGQRLMVVEREKSRMAFPVDEVHGVVRYWRDELSPVPATLRQAAATYTIGLFSWRERRVGCLDDQLLFHTLDKSFA
jgi:chemotaxis-related protein WspD